MITDTVQRRRIIRSLIIADKLRSDGTRPGLQSELAQAFGVTRQAVSQLVASERSAMREHPPLLFWCVDCETAIPLYQQTTHCHDLRHIREAGAA